MCYSSIYVQCRCACYIHFNCKRPNDKEFKKISNLIAVPGRSWKEEMYNFVQKPGMYNLASIPSD